MEAKSVDLQVDSNPFAISRQESSTSVQQSATGSVLSSRQAQEVQAAMVIAKKFPRNEELAYARIMQACKRKGLAEVSMYAYSRGGTAITGPSIRMAEMLALNWGNLDFGILELEQRDGESTVMAYCIDLETNTRQTKVFHVPHERHTKSGSYKLTDPRDIYELTANQGARRLRSCILGIIPGDIQDAAIEQCEKTMAGGAAPLIDRLRIMSTKFMEEFQVTVPMLEKRLNHKLDSTSEVELVQLRKIYTSLKDGMSKRDDWFSLAESPETTAKDAPEPPTTPNPVLGEKPKRKKSESAQAPTPPPDPTPEPETEQEQKAGPAAIVAPILPAAESRASLTQAIRVACTANNLGEGKLCETICAMDFAPVGTLLSQLPSDTLKEIITAWNVIVQEMRK